MSTQKRSIRAFTVLLLMAIMILTSAVPAFASGNINTADYWNDKAQQIVNGNSVVDSNDLAKRLSRVAGKSQFTKDGVKHYTVVVTSGNTQFVGGQELNVNNAVMLTGAYTAIQVAPVTSANGPTSNVVVHIHDEADSAAQGKVVANVSSGLLNQSNVTPDTGTAMGLLSGVMPMINTLLGLLVVVISVGMTVFSALDIIYLAFPAFRTTVDNSIERGGKGTKTNKDGSTSSRWVTDDARLAMQDAEQTQGSPWGPYFKRRVLAYIFLAIILFILLTGNIFAITTLVTNALQGLFESLGL